MKIEHAPKCLTITPADRAEAVELNDVCSDKIQAWKDPERYMEVVFGLQPRELRTDPRKDEDVWYGVTTYSDYFTPYLDWMRKNCGRSAVLGFNLDLLPVLRPLCHTRILTVASYNPVDCGESLHLEGFMRSYGSYDEARCEIEFAYCINYGLGEQPVTPEFLMNHNGTYSPNPDYASGRRKPHIKCVKNEEALALLWNTWLEKEATDAQRARWEAAFKPYWSFKTSYGGFHYADPAGDCNYDGKGTMASYCKWEDFAKLGDSA